MSLSGLQGEKTHSPSFLWRICQAREVIRPLQRHYVCWITFFMSGKVHIFSLMCILKGRKHDNVKVTGSWGSSLIACHTFCDIWMQFFCWVLLDPRAVCMTLGVVLSQCVSAHMDCPSSLLNQGPERPQKEIAAVDGSVTSQGTFSNENTQVKNTECIL